MPLFDPELAKQRQAETLGNLANIWGALKNMSAKDWAIGLGKAATFPFSQMGQTDYGGQSSLDVLPTGGATEAISPWGLLKKSAQAMKNEMPEELSAALSQKMHEWQAQVDQQARRDLAELGGHLPSEIWQKKHAKLAAKSIPSRDEEGNVVYRLFRGLGEKEARAIESGGMQTNDYASFTPSIEQALKFSSPWTMVANVPENQIALIPKELGNYSVFPKLIKEPNTYKHEYEVITKPGVKIEAIGGRENFPTSNLTASQNMIKNYFYPHWQVENLIREFTSDPGYWKMLGEGSMGPKSQQRFLNSVRKHYGNQWADHFEYTMNDLLKGLK